MTAAAQGLVATNYRVRTGAFLYCALVVGIVLWERRAGPLAWTLLALQFLVYPHFVYLRARYSEQPTRAELDNLLIDALGKGPDTETTVRRLVQLIVSMPEYQLC